MEPLSQGWDFCTIFPEMGLGGCQVNILVQWDKLLEDRGARGGGHGRFGAPGMGVGGDPAGRVPSPTFTPHPGGLAGEARARDLISGCWTADVLPFGQIDIPI